MSAAAMAFRLVGLLVAFFGFASAALSAVPEAAGEVTFVQGIATAQTPGFAARFLAKGEPVYEGEILNTGAKAFALITLKDGTKLTLRPNSSFQLERFKQGGNDESAIFRILKGGVRALTGLIGKRNPQNVEVRTTTATIGIRGTSFDARLCENDCAEEQRRMTTKSRVPQPEAIVARVAVLSGSATAAGPDGQSRRLNEGSALFSGDTVRTAKASHAVLGFRDRSKVTVTADSEFKLEDVRFAGPQSDSGNFAVRVVRGGIRLLTGLLAKRDPKAATVNATTTVIGLRGTGGDFFVGPHCLAPQDCVNEAVLAFVWEPEIEMRVDGRVLQIPNGQVGLYVPSRNLLTLLDAIPDIIRNEPAPRPDGVDVNFEALFAAVDLDNIGPGFYVGMRDGDIVLRGPDGLIYLSRDEAGVLRDGQTVPIRITPYPLFLLNDPYPTPEGFDERAFRLLELLNPGDVICEIR
ncbi:MAG TPA: FecR domain-containing protein [Burkholderiales bacterium]|nr:FecR domain-containing protein [Burkholderiales bacterium]